MTSSHDLRWLGRIRMGARLIRDRDRDADSARLGSRRPTRTPAHSRLYRLSELCLFLFERQSRQVVNVACMSSIKGLVHSGIRFSTVRGTPWHGSQRVFTRHLGGIPLRDTTISSLTRDHAHATGGQRPRRAPVVLCQRDLRSSAATLHRFQRMRGNRSC